MSLKRSDNYLVISDLQVPFEAKHALKFATEVKKEFSISDENCLCVGDEIDQYFGSLYEKDPDALHTPQTEIYETISTMMQWYSVFPKMRVAESNHGQRWAKKAAAAGIPSMMLRCYQEIIQAPKGWQWRRHWHVDTKKPFLLTHGMGYSGFNAHRQMALNNGISTVHGHLHANAGTSIVKTIGLDHIWGMNTGCLIDPEAYAFHYGTDSKFKPCLGLGVVLNGGSTPLWVPYPY